MKKSIFPAALAVLSLAACNKEKDFAPAASSEEITITATRDASGTRTVVQENGTSIWWSAAEKIDVFYGPGDIPAVFTGQNDAPSATATFKGELATASEGLDYYAIYPSSESSTVAANGEMTVTVPAIQEAAAGTFADGVFPAVAVSKTTSLYFRNIAGGIKFSVGEDNVSEVTFSAAGGENITGDISVAWNDGSPEITRVDSGRPWVTVTAPEGGFVKGENYYAAVLPTTLAKGITIILKRGDEDSIEFNSDKAQTIRRGVIGKIGELSKPKSLQIKSVWVLFSSTEGAWNEYFGGTPGTDRNIAIDDEYVYIAENAAAPKLWAISIADHKDVRQVNTEGVSGGVHPLSCPRVIKNSDPSVNGGKDILACSSLTRGGEDPKLYLWNNGIDNAPHEVTLTTWATGAWYGDTFTVSGTLQDGILFFDKTDGSGNGVVTFNMAGMPGKNLYLLKRIAFNDAIGFHNGICAYYPFPESDNEGIYSPGRGVESRGYHATFTGDLKSEGNAKYTPVLNKLEYAEGRNGFVLGYNFLEWEGKRYVIYGKQELSSKGYVYVLEGDASSDWLSIINTAPVKFRRDLEAISGSFSSGNSGMDVTARIINGELYFAAQKQNIACGLYKLVYE